MNLTHRDRDLRSRLSGELRENQENKFEVSKGLNVKSNQWKDQPHLDSSNGNVWRRLENRRDAYPHSREGNSHSYVERKSRYEDRHRRYARNQPYRSYRNSESEVSVGKYSRREGRYNRVEYTGLSDSQRTLSDANRRFHPYDNRSLWRQGNYREVNQNLNTNLIDQKRKGKELATESFSTGHEDIERENKKTLKTGLKESTGALYFQQLIDEAFPMETHTNTGESSHQNDNNVTLCDQSDWKVQKNSESLDVEKEGTDFAKLSLDEIQQLEEVMEEDDLLGDDLMDSEKIDAIVQLSPNPQLATSMPQKKRKVKRQAPSRKSSPEPTVLRRIIPTFKGASSKKRIIVSKRNSPRPKPYGVSRIPSNEVFPSALRKKSVTNPGSVGFQKPPTPHQ